MMVKYEKSKTTAESGLVQLVLYQTNVQLNG